MEELFHERGPDTSRGMAVVENDQGEVRVRYADTGPVAGSRIPEMLYHFGYVQIAMRCDVNVREAIERCFW